MARTYVYVDGFNLFYRLKGKPRVRWLDPVALARRILAEHNQVVKLRYFTANVSGSDDPDRPRRQRIYLNALAAIPEVEIHYGRFLSKTITRPLVNPPSIGSRFVEVHTYEEKGSDVNLASHLLHDGWCGRYEVAAVMSNDTDLCEPIKLVSTELKKPVGVLCPAPACAKDLRNVARFVKHFSDADLAASLLPNPAPVNGGSVSCPPGWL